MAITPNNPKYLGDKNWRFTWSGGTSGYYKIFRYDDLYAYISTYYPDEQIDIQGDSNIQPPTIEVFEHNTGTPQGKTYPAQTVVQWRGVAYAKEYKIYDVDNSVYIGDPIPEDGSGYYKVNLQDIVDDLDTINYSVNVIDSQGNESANVPQTFLLSRNPDTPKMDASWDSGTTTLTITPGTG